MKTFNVTTPDGRTLKVQGEDREGAAKAAEEYVRANPLRGRAAADADAKRRIATTPDQVRALTKGFTFGFADEIDAAGAALETGVGNLAKRVTGQQPEYGVRDAFGAVMDANAQADAKFAREKPAQNIGLQIAGGMVGPGVAQAARFAGRATGLVGATVRGAAAGGVAGAVAGAGNAGGGVRERAEGAARGGVAGAVIGGAIPSVARAGQTGGRAILAPFRAAGGRAANQGAVARLREALERDGLDAPQVQATIQQWRESGVTPEFLNVAGENTRALIRAAGSQSGPARNAAQGYRNRTVGGIPNQAVERANALIPGDTRTPAQFAQRTRTARTTDARVRYGPTNAAPVTANGEMMSAIRGDFGREAIAEARRAAAANRDLQLISELDQLLDSDLSSAPSASARTWDSIRRAMRDASRQAGQANNSGVALGLSDRVDDIDSGLNQVSGLREARAHYASQSEAIRASEGLTGMARERAPNVLASATEFRPYAQGLDDIGTEGARVANRSSLRDYFGTRDQVRARLADVADAPDVRGNLNALFGREGDRFADAAGNLVQKQDHANFIAPNTGAQTQPRGQDAAEAFGAFRSIMETLGGSLRPIVERLASGLTITEAERNVLVQLGIGSPEAAMRALMAPAPVSRIAGAARPLVQVSGATFGGASAGTAPR